jgi:hypothetical protein
VEENETRRKNLTKKIPFRNSNLKKSFEKFKLFYISYFNLKHFFSEHVHNALKKIVIEADL